jgi:membrane protein DedA with SNARE-associated domain
MDLSTPTTALASVQGFSYFLIFICFMLEGPILNFIVAFASSLGVFNVFIILLIAIGGNITADITYFYIGKLGGRSKFVQRYLHRSITSNRMNKINKFLKDNPKKTIITIKLTPIIPVAGIMLAGMTNMSLKKFLSVSIWLDIITCSIITAIGFYSGALFGMIFKYFDYGIYAIGIAIVLIVLFWLLIKYILAKISNKIEKI